MWSTDGESIIDYSCLKVVLGANNAGTWLRMNWMVVTMVTSRMANDDAWCFIMDSSGLAHLNKGCCGYLNETSCGVAGCKTNQFWSCTKPTLVTQPTKCAVCHQLWIMTMFVLTNNMNQQLAVVIQWWCGPTLYDAKSSPRNHAQMLTRLVNLFKCDDPLSKP